jgi:hypothetical protein
MHERKKRISKYLEELLSEPGKDCSSPKNKLMAKALIDFALDEEKPDKIRLEAIAMILDRLEGKALQMNLNADMVENPFDSIPTEQLEALKTKLLELKK